MRQTDRRTNGQTDTGPYIIMPFPMEVGGITKRKEAMVTSSLFRRLETITFHSRHYIIVLSM